MSDLEPRGHVLALLVVGAWAEYIAQLPGGKPLEEQPPFGHPVLHFEDADMADACEGCPAAHGCRPFRLLIADAGPKGQGRLAGEANKRQTGGPPL